MAKGGGEEEAGGTHVAISWPEAPTTSLLGVAAPVWPRTQSVGGMLWPHVLGEGDATVEEGAWRGLSYLLLLCSISYTGDLGLGPHGPPVPWGQQEGRGRLLPRI